MGNSSLALFLQNSILLVYIHSVMPIPKTKIRLMKHEIIYYFKIL